jgi:hypothetical protein
VDLGSAVVADEQPLEVMQPGEGALDDPAGAAEPGAVTGLATGDLGGDPEPAQQAPVLVVVVAAVGGDALRATTRPADQAPHGRYALEKREQLGDVVAVAARERPRERDPGGVYQEVVLGAGSGSINRARARLGAPFFACT